ncbi:MAG: hypothetical protein WD969_03845 [Paracoccaceae bacterium]
MLPLRSLTPALYFSLIAAAAAQERIEYSSDSQYAQAAAEYAVSGGAPADGLVRGCPGFAADTPAISVSALDSFDELHVYLVGEGAIGLLVARPDGVHGCETMDEYGIAHVGFRGAGPGDYLISPIAADAAQGAAGVAVVSGVELTPRDIVNITGLVVDPSILPPLLGEVPLDPTAEPAFGRVKLPDEGEIELALTLEGKVPASDAGMSCAGLIDQTRPDAVLTLAAPEPTLAISAHADVDTALLISRPDGVVECVDDWMGFDPALILTDAAAGEYAIWLGVYQGGEHAPATLRIGREAPESGASSAGMNAANLDPSAPPALGSHEMPAEGDLSFPLMISGGAYAGSFNSSCSGDINPTRPDLGLTVGAAEPSLWLRADSDAADTTLLILGPDGVITCNDDHFGSNAAIGFQGTEPGEYSVWVGSFGGGEGAQATLTVSREAPEGMMADDQAFQTHPFAGVELTSAAQALEILINDAGLGEALSFARMEETGPEGVILHDVTLLDPTGQHEPVHIGRIVVADLDLAGLSANGAPERFSFALEDVAYEDLVNAAAVDGAPLPALDNPPPLSVSVSLLPPGGDLTRRDMRLGLNFEGLFGLRAVASMRWPEGGVGAIGPMGAAATVETDALELELDDRGFLAAVLAEFAADMGQQPEALVQEALEQLALALGPPAPGSPRTQLLEALSARLNDLDNPGIVRARLSAPDALDGETAMMELMSDAPNPTVLTVEVVYEAVQ